MKIYAFMEIFSFFLYNDLFCFRKKNDLVTGEIVGFAFFEVAVVVVVDVVRDVKCPYSAKRFLTALAVDLFLVTT